MQALNHIAQWAALSPGQQDGIVADLFTKLNGFEVAYAHTYATEDPVRVVSLRETATGIVFNLIPGGTFMMGLSQAEEEALGLIQEEREWVESFLEEKHLLRPMHLVQVRPFLFARFPLRWAEAEAFLSEDDERARFDEETEPAALFPDEIGALLEATGHTLPSEAQWEYACRAGTTSLFFWGNDLPDESRWVETFEDAAGNASVSNRFGLVNMGAAGELCADTWHGTYAGAPADGSPWIDNGDGTVRVVRGGAMNLYPWQGCGEWLMLLSAARSTTQECEYGVSIRLAHALPLI